MGLVYQEALSELEIGNCAVNGRETQPSSLCWGNSSLLVVLGTQQVIAASDLRK